MFSGHSYTVLAMDCLTFTTYFYGYHIRGLEMKEEDTAIMLAALECAQAGTGKSGFHVTDSDFESKYTFTAKQ